MNTEHFDILVEKFLDQTITGEEEAALLSLVSRDPALRAEFEDRLTQASMLRRIHRNNATDSARIEIRTIRMARSAIRINKSRKSGRNNSSIALKASIAAAALITIAFMYQISQQTPATPVTADNGAVSPPKEKTVIPEVKTAEVQDVIVNPNTEMTLAAEELAGRKVITRDNAGAYISYKDGTSIEMKGNAEVRFSRTDPNKGKEAEVLAGQVIVSAAPQPQDRPLQIVSAHGRATVLGTLFWLNVDGQGTRVDLLKGKVSLSRASDNATLELAEGQRAVLAPGSDLAATPLKLEKGKLLYSAEYDPQLTKWDKSGMTFEIAKTEKETPQISTLKLLPARDKESTATLSFGRTLSRMPGSFSIEFRMRSLPFYKRDNSIHVGIDSNGAAEANAEEHLTDNRKYTFFRFKWVQCRLDIIQSTGTDGSPTTHYRSYFGNVFKYSRITKGPALGMQFVLNNLPIELAELKIYELVPSK